MISTGDIRHILLDAIEKQDHLGRCVADVRSRLGETGTVDLREIERLRLAVTEGASVCVRNANGIALELAADTVHAREVTALVARLRARIAETAADVRGLVSQAASVRDDAGKQVRMLKTGGAAIRSYTRYGTQGLR